MPLTRTTVTAASRIMLPTYVIAFAWFGLSYLFGPKALLTSSPALAFADDVMPLRAWGGVFLFCALLMCAALLLGRRTLYRFALRMCGLSMIVWALIIAGAYLAGDVSASAPVWSAFIAVACFASDRSLAVRET